MITCPDCKAITCPDCKATMDDTSLDEWEYHRCKYRPHCKAGWHHSPCDTKPGHGAGKVSP